MLWLILISAQMFSQIVNCTLMFYSQNEQDFCCGPAVTPVEPVSDGLCFSLRVCGSSRDFKSYQRPGEEKFCRPVLEDNCRQLLIQHETKKEVAVHLNPSGRTRFAVETRKEGYKPGLVWHAQPQTESVSHSLPQDSFYLLCLEKSGRNPLSHEHSHQSCGSVISGC